MIYILQNITKYIFFKCKISNISNISIKYTFFYRVDIYIYINTLIIQILIDTSTHDLVKLYSNSEEFVDNPSIKSIRLWCF